MTHRAPPLIPAGHRPPAPVTDLDYARQAYMDDRIDAHEYEAAVEHVLNGGLGNDRFPYLPAFPMPRN